MPTYLEAMLRLIHENQNAAVHYCGAIGVDEEENELPQEFGKPIVHPELYNTVKFYYSKNCVVT